MRKKYNPAAVVEVVDLTPWMGTVHVNLETQRNHLCSNTLHLRLLTVQGLDWPTVACSSASTNPPVNKLASCSSRPEALEEACRRALVGKLLPNAIYVHREEVDSLEPLLRVYEGFGEPIWERLKIRASSSSIVFPGKFPTCLVPISNRTRTPPRAVKLNLRTLELDCWDYHDCENPPVLYREETFLPAEHPLRERFARLTRQEEEHGLLDDRHQARVAGPVRRTGFCSAGASIGVSQA